MNAPSPSQNPHPKSVPPRPPENGFTPTYSIGPARSAGDKTTRKENAKPRSHPPIEKQDFPRSETAATKSPTYVPQSQIDAEITGLEQLAATIPQDPTALDRLRKELTERPHLVQQLADLQHVVELRIIDRLAPNDPVRQEAFRMRCSKVRAALLKNYNSPLVNLAVSRIVTCWMLCQLLDATFGANPQPAHQKMLSQAEKRLETAHRTYEIALRISVSLAALKK